MKKTFTCLLAATTIAAALATATTDASAQWRGRGWGAAGTEGDGGVVDGDQESRRGSSGVP